MNVVYLISYESYDKSVQLQFFLTYFEDRKKLLSYIKCLNYGFYEPSLFRTEFRQNLKKSPFQDAKYRADPAQRESKG